MSFWVDIRCEDQISSCLLIFSEKVGSSGEGLSSTCVPNSLQFPAPGDAQIRAACNLDPYKLGSSRASFLANNMHCLEPRTMRMAAIVKRRSSLQHVSVSESRTFRATIRPSASVVKSSYPNKVGQRISISGSSAKPSKSLGMLSVSREHRGHGIARCRLYFR